VFTGGQLRGYAVTGRTADAAAIELLFGGEPPASAVPGGGPRRRGRGAPCASFRCTRMASAGGSRSSRRPRAPIRRSRRLARAPVRTERRARPAARQPRQPRARGPHADPQSLRAERRGGDRRASARRSTRSSAGASSSSTDRGPTLRRFDETSDPDCPPNKRCYPLPAEVDVKKFIGHAPGGRSFVTAGEGVIHPPRRGHRRDDRVQVSEFLLRGPRRGGRGRPGPRGRAAVRQALARPHCIGSA
jgi:hypothetical protein